VSAEVTGAVQSGREAVLGTYAPPDILFVSGEGSWLVDDQGDRFLDLTSGIGVNALGYHAPTIDRAVRAALDSGLIHISNLYRTEPAERLAAELIDATFPGQVFFCNSGAEANEGAFKIARKWAGKAGGPEKHEIVAFRGSFHGRLFGSLAVTDRPNYQKPFAPLMPGVRFADLDDPRTWDEAVSRESTAAVILEPVQGEGGVRPVAASALRDLRALCDEHSVALIFDEVQCGLGRTGRLFAFEYADVRPDLLVLAKPLGGGLPMGAVVAASELADVMEPGDHATTFGGGPLVASVARAVLAAIRDEAFLARVRTLGEQIAGRLGETASASDAVLEVRGMGLMWGVQVTGSAADIMVRAREKGVLVLTAGPDVVRLLPPLTISDEDLDHGLKILQEVLP
jgi:acetylornithine/N-succinyldiaminopimelate aminotransferase